MPSSGDFPKGRPLQVWKPPPPPPTKKDCPGHVAGRDSIGRYPIGDCGPDCVLRRYRLDLAEVVDGRWV